MEAEYSEREVLRQLEDRLLQPDVRRSVKDVAELLADEFIEFGSSGRIFSKQQVIEGLQHETTTRISLMEFRTIMLAPGLVLVTYRAVQHTTLPDEPAHTLRSSIWKLIEGRWQMVFHQGTPSNKV